MHADELEIDLPTVRALVRRDFPHLAGRALVSHADTGSSNALFRLGSEFVVRLPRQPGGAGSLLTEARWLPAVSGGLPVPTPEIVGVGEPGFGYPERWSVATWIEGTRARAGTDPGPAADALARDLASFVRTLRALPVPDDARRDPQLRWYRGRSLAAADRSVRRYLAECRELPDLDLDLDACAELWSAALAVDPAAEPAEPVDPADPSDAAERWFHGDLFAENLLVDDGGLRAVLDFGGLGVGDPTVDLVVAWEVLPQPAREAFRRELDVDDATWLRGRAWAVAIAAMTLPYYGSSMPARCADRLVAARAALAG